MRLWLALLLLGGPLWAAEKTVVMPPAAPVASLPGLRAPEAVSTDLSAAAAIAEPAVPGLEGTRSALLESAAPMALDRSAADPGALMAAARMGTAAQPGEPGPAASGELFDNSGRHVMMAASEVVPFVKTGGLADVVDVLARKIAEGGDHVTLVLPKFKGLDAAGVSFRPRPMAMMVELDGKKVPARVWDGRYKGVDVKLIEKDELYHRDHLYGYGGGDYHDNDERFIFYNQAVLTLADGMERKPDVIHSHDWQAALIPAILKLQPTRYPSLVDVKTVLTIHNLAFQGIFPFESSLKAGFDAADFVFDKVEYWGQFGFLKSGIAFADAITTVSRKYRDETLEGTERGMGLQGALQHREKDYIGVTNPGDPEVWDPATDKHVPHHFDAATAAAGKAANKAEFQKRVGLKVADVPVFGVISRLTDQKGIDLIIAAAPKLLEKGAQLLITGTGDAATIRALKKLKNKHPDQVYFNPAFSEVAARQIYAAEDFVLMPSRFEPGGLTNVIAQRYGGLPIVTPTGGLVDATRDIREHLDGDGFVMEDISVASLDRAIDAALALYASPAKLAARREAAMSRYLSWLQPVETYRALYRRLTPRAAGR